ncbi:MAG: Gfo/Idh/MocA family oxidoreductase [Proteobacteria bacterium]|nr:Gfo/Idh/MocA family oxidoreductase [Pseudomonadota bacterium]
MGLLNVAVIGAGHMGRYHAEKLAACEGARLVAIVDPDAVQAGALAQKLNCAVHAGYREVLGKVDAAVVATPTEHHHEIALALLAAGAHVLVEKPLALTVAQADELVAAGKRAGRVLQTGHVQRYSTAFQALAARMDRPLYIDAERLAGFKPRGTDVDVVLDLMIHDLDLALTLARSEVTAVGASGFRVLTNDIDIANARIEFANGCVASLSASRVSQAAVRKLRVFQSDLYVSADLQAGRLRYVRRQDGALTETEETHEGNDALAEQARAFVAAAQGKAPVAVSGEHGRQALALALEVSRLVASRLRQYREVK